MLTLYVEMIITTLQYTIKGDAMKTLFSIRLKKRRRELDMTTIELGEACGLTHAAISQYETGFRVPGHDSLLLLSSALKVTTDYLLGRTEYGMRDLFSDDRMVELLEGFMHLPYDKRHTLYQFFETCVGLEERKRKHVKMTEYGIPERMKYKISENGALYGEVSREKAVG